MESVLEDAVARITRYLRRRGLLDEENAAAGRRSSTLLAFPDALPGELAKTLLDMPSLASLEGVHVDARQHYLDRTYAFNHNHGGFLPALARGARFRSFGLTTHEATATVVREQDGLATELESKGDGFVMIRGIENVARLVIVSTHRLGDARACGASSTTSVSRGGPAGGLDPHGPRPRDRTCGLRAIGVDDPVRAEHPARPPGDDRDVESYPVAREPRRLLGGNHVVGKFRKDYAPLAVGSIEDSLGQVCDG